MHNVYVGLKLCKGDCNELSVIIRNANSTNMGTPQFAIPTSLLSPSYAIRMNRVYGTALVSRLGLSILFYLTLSCQSSRSATVTTIHLPTRSFSTDSVPLVVCKDHNWNWAKYCDICLCEPPLYLGGRGDSCNNCNKIAIHENEDVAQVLGSSYPFAVASWRMSSFYPNTILLDLTGHRLP